MTSQEGPQVAQATHRAMGTVMAHRAYGTTAEESLTAVRKEIARLEGLLSRFIPGSEVSRLNRSAGMQPEKVSLETFEVLSSAAAFSRTCPGTFAVTIEPLVVLWNVGKGSSTSPDDASIQQALSLVNDQDLILDPWEMTAALRYFGQGVDLGCIGKGYAGDKVRNVFRGFGVTSAYANLGGNVVTLGTKPDGSPWRIGIQHPRLENCLIGSVSVVDQCVVTSGDYQRCFTDRQGIRRHHLLDPSTGYPSRSGLVSVTIVAERCIAADALSTILFIAGMEKGLEVLRGYPNVEAVLIDAEMQVFVTRGLIDHFQAAEEIQWNILD